MNAYILLGQSSGQGSSWRDRIISITLCEDDWDDNCDDDDNDWDANIAYSHLRVGVSIVGLQSKAVNLPKNHPERPDVRLSGELSIED